MPYRTVESTAQKTAEGCTNALQPTQARLPPTQAPIDVAEGICLPQRQPQAVTISLGAEIGMTTFLIDPQRHRQKAMRNGRGPHPYRYERRMETGNVDACCRITFADPPAHTTVISQIKNHYRRQLHDSITVSITSREIQTEYIWRDVIHPWNYSSVALMICRMGGEQRNPSLHRIQMGFTSFHPSYS